MRAAAGYTLLEMTVVLAIIGLVMSLAAPPLFKTVERYRERVALEDVQRQLQRLPVLVARLGRAQHLDDQTRRCWWRGSGARSISTTRRPGPGACRRSTSAAGCWGTRRRW